MLWNMISDSSAMATAVCSYLRNMRLPKFTLFKDLFRLVYPACCCCCGELLVGDEQDICNTCLLSTPGAHDVTSSDNLIEIKFSGRIPIEAGGTLFIFEQGNTTQTILHNIKYKGNTRLAVHMGMLLGEELMKSGRFNTIDYIIPVPLHRIRLWTRGYNQSQQICRGIARKLQKPVVTNLLYRKRYTQTQTHKDRQERLENMRDVFGVKHPAQLENKHILLVDDIITTGATMDSCYQTLKTIPGLKISIASLASTAKM